MTDALLARFSQILVDPTPPQVRDPRLIMASDGDLKIYFAPFQHVSRGARLVLVGITPGPTQMVNANTEARRGLRAGLPQAEILARAKTVAAFSGEPMRSNLLRQLDDWGVPGWLNLSQSADLFDRQSALVQNTSLLRFPVFEGEKPYAGTPDMTRNGLLHEYLSAYFVPEAQSLPDAVILGLGPKVNSVLDHLVKTGALDADRVFGGLLHPSGNNTYRIDYLVNGCRGPVPHRTDPGPYLSGRTRFQAMVQSGTMP